MQHAGRSVSAQGQCAGSAGRASGGSSGGQGGAHAQCCPRRTCSARDGDSRCFECGGDASDAAERCNLELVYRRHRNGDVGEQELDLRNRNISKELHVKVRLTVLARDEERRGEELILEGTALKGVQHAL